MDFKIDAKNIQFIPETKRESKVIELLYGCLLKDFKNETSKIDGMSMEFEGFEVVSMLLTLKK